ncbi:MAG: hypothetical protein QOJ98_728, partial [Acidobacteriota bacterium]|nr:hypothetical protein [Acidobacteriota bacterium]
MLAYEQQEQIRTATIEVFHRYLRARGELVRLSGVGDNTSDDDIELLAKDVEYLAAGRYLLAVV